MAVATVRTRCSKCSEWNSFEADAKIDAVCCGSCTKPIGLEGVTDKLLAGGPVDKCCRCGAADFWTHKDFPKAFGIGIVVVASLLLFITHSIIPLVLAAILDFVLYQVLPWATVCYRCKTEYRGLPRDAAHGGFDLAHQEDVEAWTTPDGSYDGPKSPDKPRDPSGDPGAAEKGRAV